MREIWIQYLIKHYQSIHRVATDITYRKWAEGTINKALLDLGDYFSEDHYEKT
jgi:hypothetical protein